MCTQYRNEVWIDLFIDDLERLAPLYELYIDELGILRFDEFPEEPDEGGLLLYQVVHIGISNEEDKI